MERGEDAERERERERNFSDFAFMIRFEEYLRWHSEFIETCDCSISSIGRLHNTQYGIVGTLNISYFFLLGFMCSRVMRFQLWLFRKGASKAVSSPKNSQARTIGSKSILFVYFIIIYTIVGTIEREKENKIDGERDRGRERERERVGGDFR